MESLPSSSSASTTFTQGQLSRDEVQKPMHPSTANYRPPSATVFTPTIQSPPNDTTMDATSATTLSPRHHVRISWGKCGIPGSLKIRRFLETMAEEVAVQEGFQYAKILSTVHSHTYKGTQPDEAHWVGEFGPVPGGNVVKAHIYVLSRHHQGSKHRGTISRQKDYWERSALGEILYQKEWKAGVKHIHR